MEERKAENASSLQLAKERTGSAKYEWHGCELDMKSRWIFVNVTVRTVVKLLGVGNMKGRNNIELSAKDRFPYINEFIIENYKIFKEIDKWKILIKI